MIVDVFDALTSDRHYKKSYPIEKTVNMMQEELERFFNPALLDLFIENLDSFIEIRSSFSDLSENSTNPSEELSKYEQAIP